MVPTPPANSVTPIPTAIPDVARSRETVDAVIAAIAAHDADTFESLLGPRPIDCGGYKERKPQPACDNAAGGLVTAFPAGVCSAGWYRDPRPLVERFVERAGPLFAVIEGSPEFSDEGMVAGPLPSGDFRVIFDTQVAGRSHGYVAVVEAGAITLLELGCSSPEDALLRDTQNPPPIARRGEAFSEPTPTPEEVRPDPDTAPQGTRTGLANVDRVIEAIESGDPDAFRSVLVATAMQCTHQTAIGSPPPCEPDELEATVIDAFLVVGCEGAWIRADLDERGSRTRSHPLILAFVTAPNREGWHELVFVEDGPELPSLYWVSADGVVGIASACSTVEARAERSHVILRGPAWPEDADSAE